MEYKKIQWHPGFVAAMDLEFTANRKDLIFEKEYNLNTKPLEIDLLVIKKDASVHTTSDGRKASDITISVIREAKPRELFRYFAAHGFFVEHPYKGIYYIKGRALFATQIVVTGELNRDEHIWLGALSKKLKVQDVKTLLEETNKLRGKAEKELADSVWDVSFCANKQLIEEMIGDESMYEALMEIMEPKLRIRDMEREQKGLQKGLKEGIQQGIKGTVEILRDLGLKDAVIKTMIMEKYNLKADEAVHYLQ